MLRGTLRTRRFGWNAHLDFKNVARRWSVAVMGACYVVSLTVCRGAVQAPSLAERYQRLSSWFVKRRVCASLYLLHVAYWGEGRGVHDSIFWTKKTCLLHSEMHCCPSLASTVMCTDWWLRRICEWWRILWRIWWALLDGYVYSRTPVESVR